MRTNAANVAARQAVGGSDMLSKWQLMAEQARQKREGLDVAAASQQGKGPGPRPLSKFGKGLGENQEGSKRSHSAAFGTGKAAISLAQTFSICKSKTHHCKIVSTYDMHDYFGFRWHEKTWEDAICGTATDDLCEGCDLCPGAGTSDDEITAHLPAARAVAR